MPNIAPVAAMFSHSNDEIRPTLEGNLARQLRVNPHYLRGMIQCNHSREDYYAKLTGR